ncbi:MAG: M3 family metallopeptidase [Rectinemataceae bacterium]|jgi:oligoendopeptidase F
MDTTEIRDFFDGINHDYLAVHLKKEELFWATYMATSDDHSGFAEAEKAYKAFISDPGRLDAVHARIAEFESGLGSGASPGGEEAELLAGLRGWRALFEANVIEGSAGRADMERIIALEAELFAERRKLRLRHLNERGEVEDATLGALLTNEAANPDEVARESSLSALRGLEGWVLENGFLEIVKARNAFARGQGYRDFFDYKVNKSEAMSPEALFTILDDFERRTRAANARGLASLEASFGAATLKPWNQRFRMSGDLLRETDPYFPFELSLERWIESFRRLGVSFRGAVLHLDLLEREGKYQNGFCHGPVPAFFDHGKWVPAHINFTSEGRPSQVGSGQRALETLFHEGGHAAHFANVTRNSPCFSQEFPPTSMAYAETQSMFCDSILSDADWLTRYAKKTDGTPIPHDLVRRRILRNQPFFAFGERMILVVPYFERELYALDDGELEAGRVLGLAREAELRILGVESSRPLLAIPHLLNQESAASYHGYLLADMAVYQTRAWFLDRFGYIADNPAVGRLLAEKYWAPGNSLTQAQTLRVLTGEGFSGRCLAEACNASAEEAWDAAEEAIAASLSRAYPTDFPSSLGADIAVVHGIETIADNSTSEARMCADFAAWVRAKYPRG